MKALFPAKQFTPTKWASSEDKAQFATYFVRFLREGCPAWAFTDEFYERLSNTFYHIAHFDRQGFYRMWFSTAQRQLEFINHTLRHSPAGSPEHTWCDVEKALITYLDQNPELLELFEARAISEYERPKPPQPRPRLARRPLGL